jgi:hypothetical protein
VSAHARSRAELALALVLPCASCVLPDYDIGISNEAITNRHPVRIVEPTRLTAEAQAACDDPDTERTEQCPQPPPEQSSDVLPHFLDPVANPLYAFCSCPIGQQDTFARPNFPIYIEDRDEDAERNVDDLYAALLLDPSPSNPNPQTAVRYRIYVNPQDPIPRASSIEYNPIGRADPLLRELRLGNEFRDFDFCNGGSDVPLAEGMHALVVMITDRPWFTPTSGAIQEGVPDLAAGATFDALTYVFSCASSTSERCASQCKPIEELP